MKVSRRDSFSTPLWIVPPEDHFLQKLPALESQITALSASTSSSSNISLFNGWRLENPHLQPGLHFLKDYLVSLSENVLSHAGMSTTHALRIVSWVNMHYDGGYNILHHHSGSVISGVLYVSVPEGSGNLRFRDPRPGVYISSCRNKSMFGPNELFPDEFLDVKPFPGLALLFPDWLEHMVAPSTMASDSARLSIAFNVNY